MEMTAETVYLTRGALVIRDLCAADVEPIVAGEIAQGWQGATREKYDMRLRDAAAGRCIALCASLAGAPVGYINLYFKAFPPYEIRIGRRSSISACSKSTAAAGSARR